MAKKTNRKKAIAIIIAILLSILGFLAVLSPQIFMTPIGYEKVTSFNKEKICDAQIPFCGYCAGKVINDECWERKE